MADALRIGFIGTGKRKPTGGDRYGFAMAYEHANGYREVEGCEMVACADISEENGKAFAEAYGIPESGVHLDYRVMLERERLDVVSVCTWMSLHEQMVLDCVAAGVKAIHCEKPMADTWGGARRMAEAAGAAGVQLTFNHQRRYGAPYTFAKSMAEAGEIGGVLRLECECGNIYDSGTHFIDMMSFFQGDRTSARWVIAQIDYRKEDLVFGGHCENQQVMLFEYTSGVFGLVMTGTRDGGKPVGVINRIIGETGMIDVGVGHGPSDALRIRKQGEADWRWVDTAGEGIHGPHFVERAIADVVDCLRTGRKCQLDASNALVATELIFGAYESSRRRGRVDFPLTIDDNPLEAMVQSGDLQPAKG